MKFYECTDGKIINIWNINFIRPSNEQEHAFIYFDDGSRVYLDDANYALLRDYLLVQ
jgi:hypothetical protein